MENGRSSYDGGREERLHAIILFIPVFHLEKRGWVLDEHITGILLSRLQFKSGVNPVVAFTHYGEYEESTLTIARCGKA